jgi:hypothetical protein
MGLRALTVLGLGVFVTGTVLGILAQRRGIPPAQVRPWLTRGALRGLVHAIDRIAPARSP